MIEHAIGESGAEQGILKLRPPGHADPSLVKEGACALAGGEQFVPARIENHRLFDAAAFCQRDRNGVLRQAMYEVGRAIERVDYPPVFAIDGALPRSRARLLC